MSEFFDVLEGFRELHYLEQNPDVRNAIAKKHFTSGWHHFVTFGFRESRPGVDVAVLNEFQRRRKKIEEKAPPAHLRKRVHGTEDLLSFDAIGRTVANDIIRAATSVVDLPARAILDFGCGCGRVMKYLCAYYPEASFTGSDIDAEAIAWCKQNLADLASFEVNGELPPLPFADRQFDLVYAVSVFTHLPEDMQFAWLEELRRITAPGGYLVLTTHGEAAFKSAGLRTEQMTEFNAKGFFYLPDVATEGLPDFYQNAFHKHSYVSREWGKVFDIIRIMEKGINNHQDLVLCRRN